MADLARRLELTLLLGSIPERIEGDTLIRNTSVLLGPDGALLAVYRKIHLFDIDLPGMEHLKESKAVRPGIDIVVADSPVGPLGLTICYDVRFPELYRELARRGARVLCVPAAFTERTGKAHWEPPPPGPGGGEPGLGRGPGPGGTARRGPGLLGARHDRGSLGRDRGRGARTAKASPWPIWTSAGRTGSGASCRPSTTPACSDPARIP